MQTIDNLIESLEILLDALRTQNATKASEAVTIVLLQFRDVYGHSSQVMSQTLPILAQLKRDIQAQAYDSALGTTLALVARFRQVRATLQPPPLGREGPS